MNPSEAESDEVIRKSFSEPVGCSTEENRGNELSDEQDAKKSVIATEENEVTSSTGNNSFSPCPNGLQQSDYVGLALKQWSVYLGNVLLNFIHKMPSELLSPPQRQQSDSDESVGPSYSQHDTTVTTPTGYCPCCHYHNQLRQKQSPSSAVMTPDTHHQILHHGYYNYAAAANFSSVLTSRSAAAAAAVGHQSDQNVQDKDLGSELGEDTPDDESYFHYVARNPVISLPVVLPPCTTEVGRLAEISLLVASCIPSPLRRDSLAAAIEREGYVKKLTNAFCVCEEQKNMEGLRHLFSIMKNVFLLNSTALFELLFAEDTIFDVVGCLEYEPNYKPKKHRRFLQTVANFRQVVKIDNAELLDKIHQTFRVQYIQDVVLPTPSVFEENMLTSLSSFIFFNKVEIVSLIQEDQRLLRALFDQLKDGNTDDSLRKESVLFLKELCIYSQTLQPQARESFFRQLKSLGILSVLVKALSEHDQTTKAAAIDILLFTVDFAPSVVREYIMAQHPSSSELLLINVMVEQMARDDADEGGAVQLMGVIRTLLDPENMLASSNKCEKMDFLNYFYKHCMNMLTAPVLANNVAEKPMMVQLLSLILELLSFCVEHHSYHIKNYILHKDLVRSILGLMKSPHTFLSLCALRFLRKIISLKDKLYNHYIIKGNLIAPVVDSFMSNNGRYNLLDSAILELFEFIISEEIMPLCMHVLENYQHVLEKVTYVQTFKTLKLRCLQQQQHQIEKRTPLEGLGSVVRLRRDHDVDEHGYGECKNASGDIFPQTNGEMRTPFLARRPSYVFSETVKDTPISEQRWDLVPGCSVPVDKSVPSSIEGTHQEEPLAKRPRNE